MKKLKTPHKSHLFVCTHTRDCGRKSCGESGSMEVLKYIKDRSKEMDLGKKGIRISKSGCLGPCEKGPVVMKYPQGDLYVGVKLEDCEEILNEFL